MTRCIISQTLACSPSRFGPSGPLCPARVAAVVEERLRERLAGHMGSKSVGGF